MVWVLISNESKHDFHIKVNETKKHIESKHTYSLDLEPGKYKLNNHHRSLKFKLSGNKLESESCCNKLEVKTQKSYYIETFNNNGESICMANPYIPTERVWTPCNFNLLIK